jgi:hypothetical protein
MNPVIESQIDPIDKLLGREFREISVVVDNGA